MGALLIDFEAVPEAHCNDCLEDLFKALAQNPSGDDRSIWAPHENPWLTAHVEDVTSRLQAALSAIQDAIARLLTGEPIGDLAKADPPWLRWSESEFQDARMRLEAIPASRYTLDDWMLVVDYLIQKYLPDGVISTEAEYLTVRAQMLGKIAANMSATQIQAVSLPALSMLVPTELGAMPPRILSPIEQNILAVAKARAAENISSLTNSARHRMKTLIIEHVQAQVLGHPKGTSEALRSRIFDEFGQLNRDMRRIAVTEAGECCNSGFIAAQKAGQKVQRQEAYKGACDFCRSINGKVFTVRDPADPTKDGQTDVWLGKNNIGRSAAPRKRAGGYLIEREPKERWWPAAGVQHPHCRGAWVAVVEKPAPVSAAFADWLEGAIAKASRIPDPK